MSTGFSFYAITHAEFWLFSLNDTYFWKLVEKSFYLALSHVIWRRGVAKVSDVFGNIVALGVRGSFNQVGKVVCIGGNRVSS